MAIVTALSDLLSNSLVQIFIGIGIMIALITLSQGFANWASPGKRKQTKQIEEKLRKEVRGDLDDIRKELESLRSLTLDHSMSLDRNVEVLQQRLDHLDQGKSSVNVSE